MGITEVYSPAQHVDLKSFRQPIDLRPNVLFTVTKRDLTPFVPCPSHAGAMYGNRLADLVWRQAVSLRELRFCNHEVAQRGHN